MLVDTFGTAKVDEAKIAELVRKNFQLTPKGIIESLDLRRPIYRKTAAYGHFGRNDADFTWEKTDKAALCASRRACRNAKHDGESHRPMASKGEKLASCGIGHRRRVSCRAATAALAGEAGLNMPIRVRRIFDGNRAL